MIFRDIIAELLDFISGRIFKNPEPAQNHRDSSHCPFCKGSSFATDVYENDFILQKLQSFLIEQKTDKNKDEILDRYTCELTAYMNGRMVGIQEESRFFAQRLFEVVQGKDAEGKPLYNMKVNKGYTG